MNQPSLDELMKKVDSRYTLVVVVAKRARMLTETGEEEGDNPAVKPVTRALHEVVRGQIRYRRTKHGFK
ncbi:DNA-directed RNA polymerase subunit omega [Desulfofundulus sp. TPOSR]|uniref:DNA-directed RNA polymerase subunit omega n=1 Tax=Desulfofundulus kuznetsovii (strain DSM 6115 / VKM B-1805 / 17) TaxID=760568 RepID=A0AAU8PV28_DESK7|nr:DNA-directed RNA polymerase subunit omega [Desulfofundulus sp. TPOSR]AEG14889.1 DNA-directed RNA polymerase subunit omega [Desulfofundulus kuznetsovii DSM 6115]NHM25643.1 DNA-directed RNA polymerase subunit omega [Desulfofundulus sp. TPOSR]